MRYYKIQSKIYCPHCHTLIVKYDGAFGMGKPFLFCKSCGKLVIIDEILTEWKLMEGWLRIFYIFSLALRYLSYSLGFVFLFIIGSMILGFTDENYFILTLVVISILTIGFFSIYFIKGITRAISDSNKRMTKTEYIDFLKKIGVIKDY